MRPNPPASQFCFASALALLLAALGQARGTSSLKRGAATARLLGIRGFDLEASIVEPGDQCVGGIVAVHVDVTFGIGIGVNVDVDVNLDVHRL